MTSIAFPDMHDWTLSSVKFDWETAAVTLRFQTADGPRALALSEAIDLHVPMHQSWGPSVSVNRAEWAPGLGDAIQTLRIEMQSGDVITIDAAAFDLD